MKKTQLSIALGLGLCASAGLVLITGNQARAGAYVFAGGNTPDLITHPIGYTGAGGDLTVSVCIDPASEAIGEMAVSIKNSVFIWNQREAVSPNLFLGGSNDIPSGTVDFESTITHEIGHCIGLAHPNLATESGLPNADRNYTKTTQGADGTFNLNAGPDNIKGSADDIRGDDVNLHWFNTTPGSVNNPFVLNRPVDGSTMSNDVSDLPAGAFAANADRSVAAALGFPNSEAVMQQGAFFDEDQRQLTTDDISMIELAEAGLDRTAGTGDDYNLVLEYVGVSDNCDISVRVTGTSFAFCSIGFSGLPGNHGRISTARVQMGSTSEFNWFFNQEELSLQRIFRDRFED